ncbi:MAG TPA: hypothetical protein VE487_21065, partial [Ilumatobacter sp.]|nr:hypothetical protein [Ilumatobacter sp.]
AAAITTAEVVLTAATSGFRSRGSGEDDRRRDRCRKVECQSRGTFDGWLVPERDAVDAIRDQWAVERPDVDVSATARA